MTDLYDHEAATFCWEAGSEHCPHGDQPSERHRPADDCVICLDAPMPGDYCPACTAEHGEPVPWARCLRNPAVISGMTRKWTDITPADAADIDLTDDLTITAPLNEAGKRCPWPWEPQQLAGAPMGQYHCPYCSAMVMAGVPHIDYAKESAGGPQAQ